MKTIKKTVGGCVFATLVGVAVCLQASVIFVNAQRFSAWSEPVNLGPNVNSSVTDGCPSIAANGLDLFFASNREGGLGSTDIYVAQRQTPCSSHWDAPFSLGPNINTASADECPTPSLNGRSLYFVSSRPGGCGGTDIYVSRQLISGNLRRWTEPENLGCELNGPGNDLSPTFFEDHDGTVYMYFSSGLRPGGLGFGDIYFARQLADGSFGPVSPVVEFNTTFNDIRPNIRRDGLEIYFDSNRPGSMGGMPDIYVSTRECTSCPWTTPVNLGPPVNTSGNEGRASLSFDGTNLYFMSDRPGGLGLLDIYVASRSRLPRRPLLAPPGL
ncbi:MAG: hypothetical protein ABR535_06275 [Pyrinomonadaceae bacterium]